MQLTLLSSADDIHRFECVGEITQATLFGDPNPLERALGAGGYKSKVLISLAMADYTDSAGSRLVYYLPQKVPRRRRHHGAPFHSADGESYLSAFADAHGLASGSAYLLPRAPAGQGARRAAMNEPTPEFHIDVHGLAPEAWPWRGSSITVRAWA